MTDAGEDGSLNLMHDHDTNNKGWGGWGKHQRTAATNWTGRSDNSYFCDTKAKHNAVTNFNFSAPLRFAKNYQIPNKIRIYKNGEYEYKYYM